MDLRRLAAIPSYFRGHPCGIGDGRGVGSWAARSVAGGPVGCGGCGRACPGCAGPVAPAAMIARWLGALRAGLVVRRSSRQRVGHRVLVSRKLVTWVGAVPTVATCKHVAVQSEEANRVAQVCELSRCCLSCGNSTQHTSNCSNHDGSKVVAKSNQSMLNTQPNGPPALFPECKVGKHRLPSTFVLSVWHNKEGNGSDEYIQGILSRRRVEGIQEMDMDASRRVCPGARAEYLT